MYKEGRKKEASKVYKEQGKAIQHTQDSTRAASGGIRTHDTLHSRQNTLPVELLRLGPNLTSHSAPDEQSIYQHVTIACTCVIDIPFSVSLVTRSWCVHRATQLWISSLRRYTKLVSRQERLRVTLSPSPSHFLSPSFTLSHSPSRSLFHSLSLSLILSLSHSLPPPLSPSLSLSV